MGKYGPLISGILVRQFPSVPADVIDDLLIESLVRIWRRLGRDPSNPAQGTEDSLFPLIYAAARNRVIDHLRYSPRLVSTSPMILAQLAVAGEMDAESPPGEAAAALQAAIAELEPLDRRILAAAVDMSETGDWTRQLALELLAEENRSAGRAGEFDARRLERLRGKLRVRKMRVINKLRETMRSKGFTTP